MVDAVTVGFLLVGALFLLFGATFSSYGVGALGLVVGGSGGYLLAPSIGGLLGFSGLGVIAGSVLAGALIGAALSYVLLSMAVAAIALIIGTYLGLSVIAGAFVDGGLLVQLPIAFSVGLVFAVLGMVFTKTMTMILTAFIGAAIVSLSVSPGDLAAAQAALHPEPILFDITAPIFLGIFAVGILVQFGIFKLGYVTRLLTILPGARPLRNRARGE